MIRALVVCLALLTATAAEAASRFSAMTYNIRLDLASEGANAWPYRRKAVASLIAYYAPDLVGMQEVLHHQKDALETDLPDYAFVGVARDDGARAGEYSPIGYRRERYRLVQSGTFWLSPTPDRPSKGWDAAYPRIVTWARLRDRNDGRFVLAVNTHLDHVGAVARLESARLIRRWLGANHRRAEALVLLGDFNGPPSSPAHAAITARGPGALRDTLAISRRPHFGPPGTFNGFKIEQAPDSPIDHIFVGSGIVVLRHATLTQHDGGRLPSDHYPVLADLCTGPGC